MRQPLSKLHLLLFGLAGVTGIFIGICMGSLGSSSKEAPGVQVPAACLDALSYADEGFSLASEGFTAVSKFDATELEEATKKMSPVAGKYATAKSACREAAR